MLNLIRRDAILLKQDLLIFIPFIAFFIIMDTHPVLTLLVASIFIPFNAFYYDKKSETNILLNSLPYTRKEIVASRYLGAIVYMVLAFGVTSLVFFVSNTSFSITDIAMAGGLFLLFAAFTFPLFYIFKPVYIFYVVLVSFLLLAGIGPPIVIFFAENLSAITDFIYSLSIPVLYTGATVAIMIIYAVSWLITFMIYQRKVF